MIKDGSGSTGSGSEPTQIDLGDDLIEKTAIIPGHPSAQETSDNAQSGQPLSDIQSARILLGEGFPEEAKKALRQILVSDPENREARQLLDEIHDAELKQIFGNAEPVRPKSLLSQYDESILRSDSEEIIRLLERDLRPGLKGAGQELSFFSDPGLLDEFAAKMEREIGDSPRDRVDLAIGFIEMGLYTVAIRLLHSLVSSSVEQDRLNATALVAYAHISNEEPYEAISVLQPVLNDNDVAKTAKTEIFYLMGRALQALSLQAEAIGWYLQAHENEAGYRDSAERVSRCKTALNRGPARK